MEWKHACFLGINGEDIASKVDNQVFAMIFSVEDTLSNYVLLDLHFYFNNTYAHM